jgi:hypothetical protein
VNIFTKIISFSYFFIYYKKICGNRICCIWFSELDHTLLKSDNNIYIFGNLHNLFFFYDFQSSDLKRRILLPEEQQILDAATNAEQDPWVRLLQVFNPSVSQFMGSLYSSKFKHERNIYLTIQHFSDEGQ